MRSLSDSTEIALNLFVKGIDESFGVTTSYEEDHDIVQIVIATTVYSKKRISGQQLAQINAVNPEAFIKFMDVELQAMFIDIQCEMERLNDCIDTAFS